MLVHIIVGTPGRILDLAGKGVANLSNCHTFVMDEADKLLSPEFEPVVEQLLSYLPKNRQIMLFSATFPMMVKNFKVSFILTIRTFSDPLTGQKLEQTVRNQPYGQPHTQRRDPILRLCRRAPKGSLLEHSILQGTFVFSIVDLASLCVFIASNQSVDHLL
jgi:ATP-dependent RNA helicase DDX6/DHH1